MIIHETQKKTIGIEYTHSKEIKIWIPDTIANKAKREFVFFV